MLCKTRLLISLSMVVVKYNEVWDVGLLDVYVLSLLYKGARSERGGVMSDEWMLWLS